MLHSAALVSTNHLSTKKLERYQLAANQLRSNHLRCTAEEGAGQGCEILSDGQRGYVGGFSSISSELTTAAG